MPRVKKLKTESKPSTPRQRGYSNEDKAKALTMLELNGGNITQTAKELGIHFNTLRMWRDSADTELIKAHQEERGNLSKLFEDEIHSILSAMPVARIDASYSQLATGLTSLFDRWQRLNGLPTEIAELIPPLVTASKGANIDLVQMLKGILGRLQAVAEENMRTGMSGIAHAGTVEDERLLSDSDTVNGAFEEIENDA